jgi:hypothetical protein
MRPLLVFVLLVLVAALVLEAVAVGGAWWLHRQGRLVDEINWLSAFRPVLFWDRGLEVQIDKLFRERVRRDLASGRLDRAVGSLRQARARSRATGSHDRELVALGIETYTRAADLLESQGRLAAAADWDDTLFVFAVRAPEAHHRYAAVAAFVEGLDLRARDGRPCAALARIEWARKGLGGVVPGLNPSVEEDMAVQCEQSRRRGRAR